MIVFVTLFILLEFTAEILTSPIVSFSDNRRSGYNFGVKLPSALPIILAEFRAELPPANSLR
jgi:hypothetical protein